MVIKRGEKMKSFGCEYCNDLRYIEPAKYIGGGDKELREFIEKAKEKKQFVHHYKKGNGTIFEIIDKCPNCGYEFTEEDYDSYT